MSKRLLVDARAFYLRSLHPLGAEYDNKPAKIFPPELGTSAEHAFRHSFRANGEYGKENKTVSHNVVVDVFQTHSLRGSRCLVEDAFSGKGKRPDPTTARVPFRPQTQASFAS